MVFPWIRAPRAELILIKELLTDTDRRAYNKEKPYVMVDNAPCQEVVIRENIDILGLLPVVWHLKEDAGPYITPGGLVQKDPDNGLLNIGVRRHMVSHERYGPNQVGVQIGTQTPGGKIIQKYHDRGGAMSYGDMSRPGSGYADIIDLLIASLLDGSSVQ